MKKLLLSGLSIVLFSLMSIAVYAQSQIVPQSLKNAFGFIFGVFPQGQGFSELVLIIYLKALLWIILIVLFHYALSKSMRDQKRITRALSIILALMGVIFMPNGIVLLIATAYSWVAIGLLLFLPLYFLYKVAKDKKVDLNTGWIWLTLGIIFLIMAGFFINSGESNYTQSALYSTLGEWSGFIGAVLLFIGIMCFVSNMKRDGGGSSSSSESPKKTPSEIKKEKEKEKEDAKKKLEALKRLLEHYYRLIEATAALGNNILTARAAGTAIPNETIKQLDSMFKKLNEMSTKQIQPLLEALATEKPDDEFKALRDQYAKDVEFIETYGIEFQARLAEGRDATDMPEIPT